MAVSGCAGIRAVFIRAVLVVVCCLSLGVGLSACDRRHDELAPRAAPGGTHRSTAPKPSASLLSIGPLSIGPPQLGQGPRPVPNKVLLGAFVDLLGQGQIPAVALRRKQLGRDFRILHYYYEWADPLPKALPALGPGGYPLISWRGVGYASILSGAQDGFIARQADQLARYGKPVFLRWAWEMNGSWYAWGGAKNGNDPAAFVRAWRHIHDIFQAHHATNVAWTWGPNWYSLPNEAWNDIAHYYPGDQYVDWVAISGYGDSKLTPGSVYDSFYQRYAGHKPIMIAETGVLDRGGTTKPDWIDALGVWVKAHPAVAAVVWYDTDHSPGTPENFRLDSTPGSLAAFSRLASDPYFSG